MLVCGPLDERITVVESRTPHIAVVEWQIAVVGPSWPDLAVNQATRAQRQLKPLAPNL